MRVIPVSRVERVQFYENHLESFAANAAAIGLAPADVTELANRTAEARAAYNEQQAAILAARTATAAFYHAAERMSIAGEAAISRIRSTANGTSDPNVYVLAEIPAPARPTSRGAPGKPFDFRVTLGSTGAINLRWKNTHATGAVYVIHRRLDGTGPFDNLASVGAKRFTDHTVPAGTRQVEYQVQAMRSTGVSDWAMVAVNLGNNRLGLPTAAMSEKQATKLAA